MPNVNPLAQAIMDWFSVNKRALPWRETYDPYHVWISEIMLQQTQMERGVIYFNRLGWSVSPNPSADTAAEAQRRNSVSSSLGDGQGYIFAGP
jgi:A/G-specific adenine glycosylase